VWLGAFYKIKKLLLQVGGGIHDLKITKNYQKVKFCRENKKIDLDPAWTKVIYFFP
jgi:hypothetical protein